MISEVYPRSSDVTKNLTKYEYFYPWVYDQSVAWMKARREEVLAGGPMTLGFGEPAESVVTMGRHTPDSQIPDIKALADDGILLRRIERGGGVTAHEPGQLLFYPIVSLAGLGKTVPEMTADLEGMVIGVLSEYGIEGRRDAKGPGIYVDGDKIASIGFHVHRGVLTHGVAINVTNDCRTFSFINACGIDDLKIVSMKHYLREARQLPEIAQVLRGFARQMWGLH